MIISLEFPYHESSDQDLIIIPLQSLNEQDLYLKEMLIFAYIYCLERIH